MKLRFTHWSDSHNDTNSIVETQKLISNIPDLDFSIHTGDAVYYYFQEDVSSVDFAQSLFVLGNHECLDVSGYNHPNDDWTKQPTQTALYNKFFKPYKEQTNIEIEPNKTYWYKKFGNVVLVGLNDCLLEGNHTAHEFWLRNLLDRCLQDGLKCVFANHYTPSTKALKSNFTSKWYYNESGYYPSTGVFGIYYPWVLICRNIINEYINSGLEVICHLHGHEHADGFFVDNGVPEFTVGSTKRDSYNDVGRSDTTKTNSVVLNLYEYDFKLNSLTCWRLGADSSKTGQARKMLVWCHNDKRVLTQAGL